MKIKIISDLNKLNDIESKDVEIELLIFPKKGNKINKIIKYFFISFKYDYFLLNFSKELLFLGLLKFFFPFNPCKFIVLDLFLDKPKQTIKDIIKHWVVLISLKSIDLIFLYSKNNVKLCTSYKINSKKIIYIPFKINSYEYVINQVTSDNGYIFSGGRSRRDFQTFVEAIKDLTYPVKIVTPPLQEAKINGCVLSEDELPTNVEIIHDDGSFESFISFIAHSKLVVIPLKKDDFASTGTSVYLLSMALKKCVIITSGSTTDGILTQEMAIIVPPEDPEALKGAIIRAYNDERYRNHIGKNGYNYAINLGDENRLLGDIINKICEYFRHTKK